MHKAKISNQPIVSDRVNPVSIVGKNLVIHTWSGSGPDYMHIHYHDDEAWHVLEGTLTFKIGSSVFDAGPGTTVIAPAGTSHTYVEREGPTKYLIILTPNLDRLISELHQTPYSEHASVLKKYDSAISPGSN